MTGHTTDELLELAEQELPRWRRTLERLAQWEQQNESSPEIPRVNGRDLIESIADHPERCRCQADVVPAFHRGMTWLRGDRIYRSSDFDTPPHEPRGSQ